MLEMVRRVACARRVLPSEAALERVGSWGETLSRARLGQWIDWRLMAALFLSIVIHFLVMVFFGALPMPEGGRPIVRQLQAFVADVPELDTLPLEQEVHLADPNDSPSDSVLSQSVAAVSSFDDVVESLVNTIPATELSAELQLSEPEPLASLELDKVLVSHGTVGAEVSTIEGAVDRITHEIALNLEQSNVLVIWLMDASISLREHRQVVASRLQRVYEEIAQLGTVSSDALLSAVVAYGYGVQPLVPPTADGAAVIETIRNVPLDETGVENVFSAVVASVNQYKAQRSRERRKVMVVIWTDESGDDLERLDEAITVCRRLAVPVFTVGPSSMFGQREGTTSYRHPEDGQIYQLPIDRGPDTARPERLRLPFWFDGPKYENLHAGVGPYGLVRLALESGGADLSNEQEADRSPFRLEAMKRYLPEYIPPAQYLQQVEKSRLRQAVLAAVDVTYRRELHGTPRLSFAPTSNDFQQQLLDGQKSVADDLITIQQALAVFGPKGMEAELEKETSPRWRAWYDLTYGRLLAMHVRCNEYNWACAVMKGKGAAFVDQESNRWEFKPDAKLNFGTSSEREAAEARRLLERCLTEHPDTPWGVLAQRELKHPFGFRVEEGYVAPPAAPRMDLRPGVNIQAPPTGIRVEERRMLERSEVKLPKL